MRASQEVRWRKRIKENEERRRRYEEAGKRIEDEQKTQAQNALDLRRLERQRMDELMRNPTQPPAPPKKPILRKGARAQGSPVCAGTANPPAAAGSPATQGKLEHERQRREWSEGLKQYIARQREATQPEGAQGADQADALSWQELKMAAEAGFEELLRNQEAAAAEQALQGTWRRPGMSRPKGGAPYGVASAAAPTEPSLPPGNTNPMSSPVCGSPTVAAPGGIAAGSSDNSPTAPSKWAARMKHMLDRTLQDTSAQDGAAGHTADQIPDIAGELDNAVTIAEHLDEDSVDPSQELVGSTQPQPGSSARATLPVEWQQAVMVGFPPAEAEPEDSRCGLPPIASGGLSPRFDANARTASLQHVLRASGSQQVMPAAAQQTVNALRASMEKLHRATEVMHNSMQLPSPRTAVLAYGGGPAAASVLQGSLRSSHHQQSLWVRAESHQSQQDEIRESVQQRPAAASGSPGHTHPADTTATSVVGTVASPAADPSERSLGVISSDPSAACHVGDANLMALHSPGPAVNTSRGLEGPEAVEQLSPPRLPVHETAKHLLDFEEAHTQHVQQQQLSQPLQTSQQLLQRQKQQQQQPLQPQLLQQTSYQQQHVQHSARPANTYQVEQEQELPQADQPVNTGQWALAQKHPLQVRSPAATTAQQRTIADLRGSVSVAAGNNLHLNAQEADSPAQVSRPSSSHTLVSASSPAHLSALAAASPVAPLPAAETAVGANEAGGPTLDSLLVEVQQLAELRKALKSELAAMGQDHIVAAMGTMRLSADKKLPNIAGVLQQQGQKQQQSLQAQCGSQQHPQALQDQQPRLVEDVLLQDVQASQDRQQQQQKKEHYEIVQPPTAAAAAAPAVAVASADPAVVPAAASPAHTKHPRQPQTAVPAGQPVQPALTVPSVVPQRHQNSKQEQAPFRPDVPQLAALGSQAGVQQHQSLQRSQDIMQAHLQQQPLELQLQDRQQHSHPQVPCHKTLVHSVEALRTASPAAATDSGAMAVSPPGPVAAAVRTTGNPDPSSSEMDMSFSFGQGDKYQHEVAPDSLRETALQGGSQLEDSVNFKLPEQQVDLQQLPVQLYVSVGDGRGLDWQQRLEQQQQWLMQPQQQQQQEQSQQMQQQQQWLAIQQGQQAQANQPGACTPTIASAHIIMPSMQPMLQWNVPGLHVPVCSAAAYSSGTPAAPVYQQLAVPAGTPYSASPVSPTIATVAAQLAPRPARAVAAAGPQPTSQPESRNQRPVSSRWVSDNPTSRKRVTPNLPVSGILAGPAFGAAAATTGPTSPAGSQTSAASGGGFLVRISKQASKGQATSSQAATTTTSNSSSAGAAERPSNQGSYLAAALSAKKRLEKEQAERQQIEAAAAAARTAAAERLQKAKQQAQQAAVTAAQQQVLPVAFGSYSQHAAEADEGLGSQQSSHMQGTLQHRQAAQQPSGRPVSGQSHTAVNNFGHSRRERVVPIGMQQPTPSGVAAKSPYRTAAVGASRPVTPDRAQTLAAPGRAGRPSPIVTLPASKIPTPPLSRIPSAPGTPFGRTVQQEAGPIAADPLNTSTTLQQQGEDNFLLNSYDSDLDHLERAPDRTTADFHLVKGTSQAARGSGSRPDGRMQQQTAPGKHHLADGSTGHTGDASLQHNTLWEAVRAATAASANHGASGRSVLPAAQSAARPAGLQGPLLVPAPADSAVVAQLGEAGAIGASMPAPGAMPAPGVRRLGLGAHAEAWQQQQHAAVVSGKPGAGSTREAAGGVAAPNHYARPQPSPVQPDTKQRPRATTAIPSTGAGQTARRGLSTPPAAPTSATRQAAATCKSPKAGEDSQKLAAEQQRLQESLEALDMRLAAIKGGNDTARTQAPPSQAQAANTAPRGPAKAAAVAGAGKAASALAKAILPSPNKAKQQRDNKLTAARSPHGAAGAVAADSSATGKQAVRAFPPGVVPPLSGNGLWGGQWPIVPGGFIHPPGGQQGMSVQRVQQGSSFMSPAGSGRPSMAWQDPQAQGSPQTTHGLGRHAAAALAAAAPMHMQQPGGMPGSYHQGGAVAPVSLPHMSPSSQVNGSHYWQQMQSGVMSQQYWPVLQQPYHQWPPQQQYGVMYPASAGTVGIGTFSRPGSGAVVHPPMSAPTGSQYMPGSPLLPTLHYHQTVMRNRTSTSDQGSDTGGLGKSPSAEWQQQIGRLQGGEANVWPPRGVETIVGGGKQTGVHKCSSTTAQQANGSIRVYKPGLLFE